MTLHASQVIVRPVISEKSMDETQRGKYTFAVHHDANKLQIRPPSRSSSRSPCYRSTC